MLPIDVGRRTQVVKGEVCKTSMQRFESARRLHIIFDFVDDSQSATFALKKRSGFVPLRRQNGVDCFFQFRRNHRALSLRLFN